MGEVSTKARICLVTTSPFIVHSFLVPLLSALSERYAVTLIANEDCSDLLKESAPSVCVRVFPIAREISLFRDVLALARMAAFFVREPHAGIVTVAPKAGLIGMAAASFARVPFRCHVFQGEVWATRRNPMRAILKTMDRLTAMMANAVLVISASEREVLLRAKVVDSGSAQVIGHGSISGIDTARFAPSAERRARLRARLAIPNEAILVLYIGRLKRDKGVLDLVAAWKTLAPVHPILHLAVVGPDEDGLDGEIRATAGKDLLPRLHISGFTREPEAAINAADILALPSYREGLGNVILEAGACELPVVASKIYGIVDALREGETGLMHPPGDRAALAQCIDTLVRDPLVRARLGAAGRAFVTTRFEQRDVVSQFMDFVSARMPVP